MNKGRFRSLHEARALRMLLDVLIACEKIHDPSSREAMARPVRLHHGDTGEKARKEFLTADGRGWRDAFILPIGLAGPACLTFGSTAVIRQGA